MLKLIIMEALVVVKAVVTSKLKLLSEQASGRKSMLHVPYQIKYNY